MTILVTLLLPIFLCLKVYIYRNIPCHSRGDAALKILQEATEDSEVRIAAYLSVMKCVDYQTFLDIKDLLKHEEVNQGYY